MCIFVHLTLSDPGCIRQLTIRGGGEGGFTSPPPPYDLENYCIKIVTISYMCILLGVLGMFQLEYLKKLRFSPFYSDFKIESIENSCKNNIFCYFFFVFCSFRVQNGQSCQEICKNNNFHFIMINVHTF